MFARSFLLACAAAFLAGAHLLATDLTDFTRHAGGKWMFVESGGAFSIVGRSTRVVSSPEAALVVAALIGKASGHEDIRFVSSKQSQTAVHYAFAPFALDQRIPNLDVAVSVNLAGNVVSVAGRLQSTTPKPQLYHDDFARFGDQIISPSVIAEWVRTAPLCEYRLAQCNPLGEEIPRPTISDIEGPFPFALAGTDALVMAFRVHFRTQTGIGISEYILGIVHGTPRILQRRSGLHRNRGREARGRVFDPNPRASSGKLAITRANLNQSLRNPYDEATLEGRYVLLDNALSFPADPSVPPLDEGLYSERRGTLEFAAGMLYHHVAGMQRYVQSIGFHRLLNCPIQADPKRLGDASFSSTLLPDQAWMLFGWIDESEQRYHAEDGDVIAHEYGHVLQWGSASTKFNPVDEEGVLIDAETGAVAEGFGDYWALSYFRRRNRMYRSQFGPACFAEWAIACGNCMREINFKATRDHFSLAYDSHRNGTVWTALLWRIGGEIRRRRADRLVLESHYFVPDRPNFCTSAMALLAADESLWKGKRRKQIDKVLRERKIFGSGGCDPVNLP